MPPPTALETRINHAASLINRKRYAEAEAILVELKKTNPFDQFINYNLANVYWEQKRLPEASRCFRQALAANPNLVPAMVNLSGVLQGMGERREALRYIQMAVRREPGNAKLLGNLAMVLMSNGEAPDALAALEQARALDPEEFEIEYLHACCLQELRRWNQLIDSCKRLWVLAKGKPAPLVGFMMMSALTRHSRWEEMPEVLERLRRELDANPNSVSPMMLAFFFDDPEGMFKVGSLLTTTYPTFPRPRPKPAEDRITVGYMSPDFREHPVAHMVLDVLRSHDRSRFKVLTIGALPPDDSELGRSISAASEGHIDLSRHDDDAAANVIRAAGVDVLVDLAGSTMWSRPGVLARRSCPVQLLWLGCPSTTGMPWYDAFLVDATVAPPGYEAHCTEPLVRLPCCYHPISTGHGTASTTITRSMLGLPEDVFLIGSRLQPAKIVPPYSDDLVEILNRCPHAHLWLKVEPEASGRVHEFFDKRGIAPTRIHTLGFFKDRGQYLASFALADLLIDSYPYGGHSTTGEALAQGLPVVTRTGRAIHTRVAASMLQQLGVPELIADSRTAYVDLVCRLSNDRSALDAVRSRTAAAAARYRSQGIAELTRALEAACIQQLAACRR